MIPKWQLADLQVAAVVPWLEARRVRGFVDGAPTTGSGAALPVAVASPTTDGERLCAVMAQLLDETKSMNDHLADVKTWQQNLQMNLCNTQVGLDVNK